jgi:hypothetical protein
VAYFCNPSYWKGLIGTIEVWGEPKQKVKETPSQSIKLGVVVYTCHPVYPGGEKEDCGPECKNGENLFEK